VGSALGVSVYSGDAPSAGSSGSRRDVEAGHDDNAPSAGTIWRTGKSSTTASSSAAMAPPTAHAMQAPEAFPGSGRTLSTSGGGGSGGGVMSALWSGSQSAATASSEGKSDRAEMAARRLAALGRGGVTGATGGGSLDQYVAGVASAPSASPSSQLKALMVYPSLPLHSLTLPPCQDMGFSHRDASAALQRSHGDLDSALNYLSASSK
jgi:hypothetical protein